jgi:hypothetical protein
MIILTATIHISETEVINIDRRNLIGISSSIYDRSDLKLPSFGIISNIGNIEFNDNDGQVLQYAEKLKLQAGQKCEIWLHNTLVETANEKIGVFETDQWNYDNERRVVSVSLKDDLEEWQNINFDGIDYNPNINKSQSLSYFYEELRNATVKDGNYEMLSLEGLDETTKNVLSDIIIQYPLLYKGSLWESWQKVCEVGQLHIYKENGIVKCRYNGGN